MQKSNCFGWLSGLMLMVVVSPAIALCQDVISDQPQAIANSIGMKLIPIPAGRFTMGSPASEPGSQEDEVLHKVELTQAFHLGSTEVTENQWALVMEEPFRTEIVEIRDPGTKRLVKKEERQIKNPRLDSQLPVTEISWSQAVEFCKRLGQLPEEKKEGRLYRLPTEAEWEYACRSETMTAFSFGENASLFGDKDASILSEYAWHAGNRREAKLMPVAQKRANAWGLFDMHGNVAEWCHDYYGEYADGMSRNPVGPDKLNSVHRVFRGGSYQSDVSKCRSGCRGHASEQGQSTVGVRVVLTMEQPATESVVNWIGQRLIKIPAGRFLMGSDKGKADEKPVHEVVISSPIFLAESEVKQGDWLEVMRTEPWKGQEGVTEGSEYPATCVSWEDSMEFCRRLSAMPGELGAGRVYRLPTEAEWEYACRGGLATEYGFGDDEKKLVEYAWFGDSKANSSAEVAKKAPNAFGLYDMHGNVWEWCSDFYGNYRNTAATDPTGPSTGDKRVLRGGSWNTTHALCKSARRSWSAAQVRSNDVGFRMVLVSGGK